jgi:hypothetical protein
MQRHQPILDDGVAAGTLINSCRLSGCAAASAAGLSVMTARNVRRRSMKCKPLTPLLAAAVAALSVAASRAAPPPPHPAQSAAVTQRRSGQIRQLQARMRLMQEQMRRIDETHSPEERAKLLHEHMQTMLEAMRAMRAMGGGMMHHMMGGAVTGRGMMGGAMTGRGMMGGAMTGRGMMGGAMTGRGMMGGASSRATPAAQRRWMQDRLDMMQMMMEQMMGQMRAMEGMAMSGRVRSGK